MKSVRPGAIAHRHKFLFGALGAIALVIVGVTIGFGILLSGGFSTAATTQHFTITHRLLDLGLHLSVRTRARDIEPPDLNNAVMRQRGMICYRQYCEQCHGAPAIAPSAEARGMLPIPVSLAQSTREWSPAELYYITKKGVRMTGMPAWEYRMSERSLWDTVAFITTLPTMTESMYREAAASGSDRCEPNTASPQFTTEERADELLRQYACHSCHRIEGVTGPKTHVGPELGDWSRRRYIAGILPNTRDNLVKWIRNPKAVDPNTLMPNLDVPESHAREMASFLLSPP